MYLFNRKGGFGSNKIYVEKQRAKVRRDNMEELQGENPHPGTYANFPKT